MNRIIFGVWFSSTCGEQRPKYAHASKRLASIAAITVSSEKSD